MERSKTTSEAAAPSPELILAELERVMGSDAFVAPARIKRLFRFLVEETLAGREDDLRGEVLARRIFLRGEGFDPVIDPIVRVEMSKLRRAIEGYYRQERGGALRIELRPGSYVPRFVLAATVPPVSGMREAGAPRAPLERPTVAVRPFVPLSQGAGDADIARGISEGLAALIARTPHVRVLPPSSAAAPTGGYVLEGSVRCGAGVLRVRARFCEADGPQVWGRSYDRVIEAADVHRVEDDVVEHIFVQIFDVLGGVLIRADAARAALLGGPPRTEYEALLRFPRWFSSFAPDAGAEARAGAELVLATDPGSPAIAAFLALLHVLSTWTRNADPDARRLAAELGRHAHALDPNAASSHAALAMVAMDQGEAGRMRHAAERIAQIGTAPGLAGWMLVVAGQWDRGAELLHRYLGMARAPGWYHHALFLEAYRRGDHESALAEAEIVSTPALAWDPLDRAAALGMVGRVAEARQALNELCAILPAFAGDPRGHLGRLVLEPALVEALLEGLARGGLQAR